MTRRILPIIITLLLLSSCGFTLRGVNSPLLGFELQQIQLRLDSSNNELGSILSRRLAASGVDVVASPSNYVLTLGTEQSLERIISVNRNVRAGEYELSLISSFKLEKDNETLIETEIISLEQIYEADPTNAAAKTNEAELVLNELRQAVVEQILRRLQTIQ